MKMKKHEVLYNRAEVANNVTNTIIDISFKTLKEQDDKAERAKEIELIKKGLDTKERFHKIECEFKERKAFRRGYIIALTGAIGGVLFDAFVTPKIVSKFKKN